MASHDGGEPATAKEGEPSTREGGVAREGGCERGSKKRIADTKENEVGPNSGGSLAEGVTEAGESKYEGNNPIIEQKSSAGTSGSKPLGQPNGSAEAIAASGQVADTGSTGQSNAPTCPICLSFLCEPLRTACGHVYCRVCLLQTTQLSPDGRACPLCRAPIKMENPCTHPVDRTLESQVRACVLSSEYELRLSQGGKKIRELQERARTTLPIFYMFPGCRVGQPVGLHLFEPRYRILIRRAMEGNKMFVYAARTPKRGHMAVLVRVTSAFFQRDGRAHIVGVGVEEFQMEDVWVEDGTAGLYYTRFVAQRGGFDPGRSSTSPDSENWNEVSPSLGRESYRVQSRRRSGSMSCTLQ